MVPGLAQVQILLVTLGHWVRVVPDVILSKRVHWYIYSPLRWVIVWIQRLLWILVNNMKTGFKSLDVQINGVLSDKKVSCFDGVRCLIHTRKFQHFGFDTSTQTTARRMVNGGGIDSPGLIIKLYKFFTGSSWNQWANTLWIWSISRVSSGEVEELYIL